MFTGLTAVRKVLHGIGIDLDNAPGSELFDIAANNVEEDLHAVIEHNAVKYLDALRAERLELVTDDDNALAEFLHFLCVQYTRTKNLRSKVLGAFEGQDTFGANVENCWGLMSHVLATNLGYGLFVRKAELDFFILRTPAEAAFITSDQPVINTKAVEAPDNTEAEELELFYPLSPRQALLIDGVAKTGTRGKRDLSTEEVARYNRLMFAGASEFMFANSEAQLNRARVE